jgi:hypothetical protein
MEKTNNSNYLDSSKLEQFYSLPIEEQLIEVFHLIDVSEILYSYVIGETSKITVLKKNEHSVELSFGIKKLIVIIYETLFVFELWRYNDMKDVFLVTFHEHTYELSSQMSLSMKYLPIAEFKKMIEDQLSKYTVMLVDKW